MTRSKPLRNNPVDSTWELIKTFIEAIIAPAIGLLIWMVKSHSKRTDDLDDRITKLEIESAVLEAQFKNIDKKLDDIQRCLERITRTK